MSDLEKLFKLVEKVKYFKKSNNVNFVPRQTLSVNIGNVEYYISLICDDNFQVQVLLLDENNNLIQKLLELDDDKVSIVKLQNKLYVFADNYAYIYDINNLKANPLKMFLGSLDLQGICANKNNIFAYSISKDKIIKYDQNLISMEEYENPYSKENIRVSLRLACNEETFFSIPIMAPKEEQYILMKKFMEYYVGSEIAKQNDQIHSCSFNYDENTLYISMYNIVWIIKNGTEFSYLYFRDNAMTSVFYDNDIKKLIVNFGGLKGRHINGSIIKLTNDEINEKAIPLTDISSTFQYSKNINEHLISDDIFHENTKRRK